MRDDHNLLARIYLLSHRLEQAAGPIERWRNLAPTQQAHRRTAEDETV